MTRNWKRLIPRSTVEAMRMCKDYAREKHNLSTERIADQLGVSADLLYKWLSNGEMRLSMVQSYEKICGIHFVSDHLSHARGLLLVPMPTGRSLYDDDMLQMHQSFAAAMTLLADFYDGKADLAGTQAALTKHMEQTAWHRANAAQHAQPELELNHG